MRGRLVLLCATLFFAIHCDYGNNSDAVEEISCEDTSGIWLISTGFCNGSMIDELPFSTISFEDGFTSRFTVGTSDCQYRLNNIIHYRDGGINLFGRGNYICTQDGEVTTSCNGAQANCDVTTIADNRNTSFNSCVVANVSTLRLSRVVSAEDVSNGLSFCGQAGDIEELSYTPSIPGPANLYFTNGAGYMFDDLLPGESTDNVELTLINLGTTDATMITVDTLESPFFFIGGAYPGTGGTCSSVLPATSACSINIGFSPTEVGEFMQTFNFNYFNGTTQIALPFILSGIGPQPLAEIVKTPSGGVSLGDVVAGTPETFLVTFTNQGNGPAVSLGVIDMLPPLYLSGDSYPGTNGTCGNTLQPEESCTIEFEFRVTGPGIFSNVIILRYFDGLDNITASVPVSARGVTAGP